ncbi:Aste57867_5123 [Aphanomyces stellatus]|uniref:Aste57867_5123 protein n=1 Tax=Aphanomyces stellatus TaxID=120398 RepID=A0A485KD05_9STRA|nr:hypothetical protein As57867_005110 [Aphanomyces stellatus]VFT82203.1 Aste57867_5123 [Aphanomyces stellatus]
MDDLYLFEESTSPPPTCLFNGCELPAVWPTVKCLFHRAREKCAEPDCCNQVYARGRCVRHGAKKPCAAPGCHTNVRFGELCSKHAETVTRFCRVEGCDRIGRVQGKCVAHGGGRLCAHDGCTSFARVQGLCQRHQEHRLLKKKSKSTPVTQLVEIDSAGPLELNEVDAVLHLTALDLTEIEEAATQAMVESISPLTMDDLMYFEL